jgi:uncharacterized RmlC-like cupin family protein
MDWQYNGVKIVPAGDLDPSTPFSPGMSRATAIMYMRTGAKLRAGMVAVPPVQPSARIAPRHYGELETFWYIGRGRTRMRGGETPTLDRIGVAL